MSSVIMPLSAEEKRERNRLSQQKRRERLVEELGVEEFRRQVATQVKEYRAKKKETAPVPVPVPVENPERPKTVDGKKYCECCKISITRANWARHLKTSIHLKNCEEVKREG